MKKTKRLGRGLDALIPDKVLNEGNSPPNDSNLFEVEVATVRANPYQPRQDFDPVALDELKSSIKENGIIQPITVRKVNNHYELIAGERRLRAIVELGFDKVPAYIIKVDTKEEMLELAIIENVQRERLNPIEQAQAFQRLVDECKLTQDEVAQKIGKDRTTITNFLRLLKLPDDIQDSVRKSEISMGHARTLLAIEDVDVQCLVWKKVIKNSLSVRQLEKIIKDLAEASIEKKTTKPRRSIYLQKAEEDLRELLGTKVNIRSRKEGGTIEVEFYSPEDLNRLLEIFQDMQKV